MAEDTTSLLPLGGFLKSLTQSVHDATESLAGIGTAASRAVTGLAALKAVSLASPAAVERFKLILEDTTAVVGQSLTPVLEIVTDALKLLGDFLASVLPSADEMRDALKPVRDFLLQLRDALASIVPFIKNVLTLALKGLGIALNALLIPIRFLVGLIEGLFGDEEKKKALTSSTGAAARSIKFQDPMAAVHEVYAAAYKMSRGGEKEKSPLDKIGDKIDAANKWLKSVADGAQEIGRAIGKALKDMWTTLKDIWKAVVDIFKKIGGVVEDVVRDIIDAFDADKRPRAPETGIPGKAEAQAGLAKTYGEISIKAQAVGMLPFGRAQAAQQTGLSALLAKMDRLLDALGLKGSAYEKGLNEQILDWAGMASRRGIDGHPGGK